MKFTYISAIIVALTVSVEAHSWIESLTVVSGPSKASNLSTKATVPDSKVGYIRAYPSRTDALANYLILHPKTDFACRASQQTATQDPTHPRLAAAPGSTVQGNYTENGHITLPLPTQLNPGKIYWYGTESPKVDEKLADIVQWNAAGTGGDKRGRLLAEPSSFDDGHCVENFDIAAALAASPQTRTAEGITRMKNGQAGPCKSTFTIPQDVKVGSTYTVYWVWDFSEHTGPKSTDPNAAQEWYTSCMDIDIVGGSSTKPTAPTPTGPSSPKKTKLVRSAKFRLL